MRARGELAGGTGDALAEAEHTGQIEADREQHIDHRGDEQRRLQLKAPADLRSGGANPEQRRGDRREAHQDARRVGQALTTHLARRRPGVLDQAKCLDRKDRQYARHEIEENTARKRQHQRPGKRERGG